MTEKLTQGRRLINLLKKRWMTTMDLLQTGISTCPWKRIKEALRDDEKLLDQKLGRLKAYRVVSITKPHTTWRHK